MVMETTATATATAFPLMVIGGSVDTVHCWGVSLVMLAIEIAFLLQY